MVTGYEGTQEAVDAKRTACTALLSGLGGTSLGEDDRLGRRAASTAPTCATRCSTSACSWRPWRR